MSLLWRPLQQIASWLDECPRVRVEHVPPAAKQEQIKGQRNPLELEVMFLSARPLFRQHFSRWIRNLDCGLISGPLPPSELSFQSTCNILQLWGRPCFICCTQMLNLHMCFYNYGLKASVHKRGWGMEEMMRSAESEGGDHMDDTETCH